jgi:hypothetical protein
VGYDVPHQLLTDIVAWEGEDAVVAEQMAEVMQANVGGSSGSAQSHSVRGI